MDRVWERSDLVIKDMQVDESLQLINLPSRGKGRRGLLGDGGKFAARFLRHSSNGLEKKLRGNILGGGRIRTLHRRSNSKLREMA